MQKWKRRDNPPPPGPQHELIRIKGTAHREFWILDDGVQGFETHWDNKYRRSLPCTAEGDQKCDGCTRELPHRWKGYFSVVDVQRGKVGFLEVTPAGCAQVVRTVPSKTTLRGLVIRCFRSSEAKESRLIILVQDFTRDASLLPPAKDVEPHLREIWKL